MSEAYDLTQESLRDQKKKKKSKRNQTSSSLGRERKLLVGKDKTRLKGGGEGNRT